MRCASKFFFPPSFSKLKILLCKSVTQLFQSIDTVCLVTLNFRQSFSESDFPSAIPPIHRRLPN